MPTFSLSRLVVHSLAGLSLHLCIVASSLAGDAPELLQLGMCYVPGSENGQRIVIPLESTEVVLDVKPGLLEAEVTQTFSNRTETALEAIYLYPLPPGATLTHFELRFNDRVVKSEVREKAQAQAAYDAAKAEGKKAALLAQHDPSLFSTAVANFLPGETVHIVLRYVQPLDLTADRVEVRFPMVTGDKYFPADSRPGSPGNAAPNPARRPDPAIAENHVYAFDILVSGIPVREITSSSHRIHVEPSRADTGSFRISLAEEIAIPDRDFILRLETRAENRPLPTFVSQQTPAGNFGLLTLFPPTLPRDGSQPARPRDVLFLIDRSGSMQGERIKSAKRGLEECLRFLSAQDRFHIVLFDTNFVFYRPAWSQATPEELRDARIYVSQVQIQGGTQMQPALAASLAAFEANDRDQIVIFLTDGDVGNADALLNLVESRIGKARLFALGIGSAPNVALLKKIAELGRGQARFIADDFGVDRELTDLFATLAQPVLSDVRLSLVDDQGGAVAHTTFPETLADVFVGRPIQSVFHSVGTPAFAVIEGFEGNRRVSQRVALQSAPRQGDGLVKEFGRRLYDDTAHLLRRAKTDDERTIIRQEMLGTALQFQLVTELTSRVAVDQIVARAPDAPLVSQQVAQYRPANPGHTPVNTVYAPVNTGTGGPEAIVLQPFSISADSDVGFVGASSLAGGRISTALRDTPVAFSVITKELLNAIGVVRIEDTVAVTLEPDSNPQAGRTGGDRGLLDDLPIVTIIDPATVNQIELPSMDPVAAETAQIRASGSTPSSLTVRIGDQGLAAVSIKSALNSPQGDDAAALGIFSWMNLGHAQAGVFLDGRKVIGQDTVRANLQWRTLEGYGGMQLARASIEHTFSGAMRLGATLAWHRLNREDPAQFRTGSPTATYDGLGFLNLDLLTSETKRLEDAIAQVEVSGRGSIAGLTQSWSARTRWHRQTSDWRTAFVGEAIAPRRDNRSVDLTYRLTRNDESAGLTARIGWAGHHTPGETMVRRHTRDAAIGFDRQLQRSLGAFGLWNHAEVLPWTSTGSWQIDGPRAAAISIPIERRTGGQFGLRVSAPNNRLTGTAAVFHENVSQFTFRDWAWERQHGAGVDLLTDGTTLRSAAGTKTWDHLTREGWMGSLAFNPTRSFTTRMTWFQDWKNAGPYRGGNEQASLVAKHEFHDGHLNGFISGFTFSYRNALTYNDDYTLGGGVQTDLMFGYRLRLLGRRETLLQLNLKNVNGRAWQPTRFATDRGRELLLGVTHGF